MSMHDDELELTPAERAAFAALPRERDPGRLLEERTVRALREQGLLTGAPGRGRFRLPHAWLVAAAAAGLAFFAGGTAVGLWLGNRSAERLLAEVQAQNARQAALVVQQTGSAWVEALANFAALQDSANPQAAAQGREVAKQLLRAAADEMVRIAPNDPVASGILAGYDRARQQQRGAAPTDSVWRVWF
jgi:hypothetical protein